MRDFYKTVTKKKNGKFDDKIAPFLSSASGSVNKAETSIINNEKKLKKTKKVIMPPCAEEKVDQTS